jgi:hypothetical protein
VLAESRVTLLQTPMMPLLLCLPLQGRVTLLMLPLLLCLPPRLLSLLQQLALLGQLQVLLPAPPGPPRPWDYTTYLSKPNQIFMYMFIFKYIINCAHFTSYIFFN